MPAKYIWQRYYEAAILTTDRTQLLALIRQAQVAIDKRIEEMRADSGGNPEEKAALADALAGLKILRKEVK